MTNKKGFTLIELLVVIVIVGILAAVAIPRMVGSRNKAKASEFPTVLALVSMAQRAHFAESNAYKNCPTQQLLRDSLWVDISHAEFFTYSSTSRDTTSKFVALATLKENLGKAEMGESAGVNKFGVKGAPTALRNLQTAYFGNDGLSRTPTENDRPETNPTPGTRPTPR